jgi:sRNA-binding regulator protein Hfq
VRREEREREALKTNYLVSVYIYGIKAQNVHENFNNFTILQTTAKKMEMALSHCYSEYVIPTYRLTTISR